uniref:Uncharacterized protein n=1 Tax=Peromyscus maniculatus bairdii TaxID=230844 RepID=A0A8C8UJD2_PERMB
MTPGIRAPFFLMLLLAIVPGEGHPVGGGAALFRWHSSPFGGFGLLFNSSLEDPSSNYYQELKRNISGLFLQIFNQDFLGISTIQFSLGPAYQAGVLPCWCWSVSWLLWPLSISLHWQCVSAAERTTGIWTSFPPRTPTIL